MFVRALARQMGRTVKELAATMDAREFNEHAADFYETSAATAIDTAAPGDSVQQGPSDTESIKQFFNAG